MSAKISSLGNWALMIGLIGFAGIGAGSVWDLKTAAFSSLLGPLALVLGMISRFRAANRPAFLAMIVGIMVTLFIPTLWLFAFKL